MDLPSLQFSENLAKHAFLKNSVKIANKFLETASLKSLFSDKFQIDPVVSGERIQNVVIYFHKQSKKSFRKQGLTLAWSYPNIRAKAIYVNVKLKKRLDILQKLMNLEPDARKEIKTITVYISFLLLHELAHLLLRWKGVIYTPNDLGEAGEYLETTLFGGLVRAVFKSKKPWKENSKFKYIAIERLERHCIKLHYISFENYIERVYDLPQNSSDYMILKFCKKPSEKNLIVLKQSDEDSQFENEEDLGQLDVVRRLFNVDVNPCGIDFFRPQKKIKTSD